MRGTKSSRGKEHLQEGKPILVGQNRLMHGNKPVGSTFRYTESRTVKKACESSQYSVCKVGKLLNNALLYSGIKTNLQKKVVAIFHSPGDGDDSCSVVARTFLIRTKTEEDRDKLDAAIKEYAPVT